MWDRQSASPRAASSGGKDLIVHESNRGDPHTPIERLNALADRVADQGSSICPTTSTRRVLT